jgi:hypothetical protein
MGKKVVTVLEATRSSPSSMVVAVFTIERRRYIGSEGVRQAQVSEASPLA